MPSEKLFAELVPSEIRDGHYIKYPSGVVKNSKTGLEWYVGPDKNTTWDDAKWWVKNLKVSGGGWHMPQINELKGLYQEGVGSRNMTKLLNTTGVWVWSGEIKGSLTVWNFNFSLRPGFEDLSTRSNDLNSRAFAVRSRR